VNREELIEAIRNLEGDLHAFKMARDAIQQRFVELNNTPQLEVFFRWPATQVVWHGLAMALARCEGLIEDYKKLLESLDVPENVVKLVRSTE
jgi:hypothetical protein